MTDIGHHLDAHGRSAFRVFAPLKASVAIVLAGGGRRIELAADDIGYWTGVVEIAAGGDHAGDLDADTDDGATSRRLPPGTLYWVEVDGQRFPDPASRYQPQGVHGPSMVVDTVPASSPGWRGVAIAEAVLYELHVGTFTADGTLSAARRRLPHLQALGINVIELMPLAEFPGERNWGYDGACLFALHHGYGDHGDLKAFIEAAHAHGIAVLLDVVYNHFGPEGNYTGQFAPYTRAADTPWGAAVNFDGAWNHGVRAFFLENLRFWLSDIGFDGVRMDAVQMVSDQMPVHILREFTDLARRIGAEQGRTVLTIAEHLRNDRSVTRRDGPFGFGYDAQWNDDLNHAIYARLTGETGWRHYRNFGRFDDVVKALRDGFVLDGTRFDRYHRWFLGTDGRDSAGHEHVVHIQNHDQVGNRPRGDRLIASHGRDNALLAITAVMASPFVPMLFMGEEYGETAPFLFFEDFGEADVVQGVRVGRRADDAFGSDGHADPHDRATFVASKLDWQRCDSVEGRCTLRYYQRLIALKRAGRLGPRNRQAVRSTADAATEIITVETPHTLTLLNFSSRPQPFRAAPGWRLLLSSAEPDATPGAAVSAGVLAAHAAVVLEREGETP